MAATYEFMKGFTWGYPGVRGDYSHHEAQASMQRLRDTGTRWVTIAFSAHMTGLTTPDLKFSAEDPSMVSDDEIRIAIDMAHRLGMKVLLKPMVDTRAGDWRGRIEFESSSDWERWWQQYKQHMRYYAAIAQQSGCEMLCMGCEMCTAERFETHWRDLIAGVRSIYFGPLTYDVNHGRLDEVAWWDAVDLISVSAYYGVGKGANSSVEEMQQGWAKVIDELEASSRKFNKPVFFAECGMMSTRGNSTSPAKWDTGGQPYDGEEQARYYEAAFRAFWDKPWFLGYFWWKWDAVLSRPEASSRNTAREVVVGENGFRINGKPAEKVLRDWYARPRAALWTVIHEK